MTSALYLESTWTTTGNSHWDPSSLFGEDGCAPITIPSTPALLNGYVPSQVEISRLLVQPPSSAISAKVGKDDRCCRNASA